MAITSERLATPSFRKISASWTPGAGFGKCVEGHVRISAFNSRENVTTALARIAAALK